MIKRAAAAVLLVASGAVAISVPAQAFTRGHLFVGVGNGHIREFTADGAIVRTIDTGLTAIEDTGMCFDGSGNLYATGFDQSAVKLDPSGAAVEPFGSNVAPESCVVDAAGNVYFGQADGTRHILRFDAGGVQTGEWAAQTGPRGTDWIDLAADQCTMYYTSEGASVLRYNVCTGQQLSPLTTSLAGPCYTVRISHDGDVFVTCRTAVYRLAADGSVIATYLEPHPGFFGLFALSLDSDGTSLWTADPGSGEIFRIDIATGALLTSFDGSPETTLGGLAVSGELTAADNHPPTASLSATPTSGPWPLGVTFSTAGTTDPDGNLASWSLNFGDGTPPATGTGAPPATVSHLYGSAGRYSAALMVSDIGGLSSTSSVAITVLKHSTAIHANPVIVQISGLKLYLEPSATLSDALTGAPLANRGLSFYAGKTLICSATTNLTGYAHCSGVLALVESTLAAGYEASFAGDANHLPATAKGLLIN